MTTPAQNQTVDAVEVARALSLIVADGGIVECRVFGAMRNKKQVVAGYYDADHFEKLARDLSRFPRADAVYITLNEIDPALHARYHNRLEESADETTSDHHVRRRLWMLVDCDPARPAKISATEDEHAAGIARAQAVGRYLKEQGWPNPIVADSGNGGHLLHPIDLPADDAARTLIERCLAALGERFDDAAVSIDRRTFNAARVCKLYGTWARKGDDTPERPHRQSRILFAPARFTPVTPEQLAALAAEAPAPAAPALRVVPGGKAAPTTGSGPSSGPFDMQAYIDRHNLVTDAPRPGKDGTLWQMDCLFNPDHKSPDAFLGVRASGAAVYHCSHNSCRDKDWYAVRDLLESGWREDKAKREEAYQERKSRSQRRKELQAQRETVGEQIKAADELPVIETNNRHLRDISDEALAALLGMNTPPVVFVRGGQLVRIVHDEHGAPAISAYNVAALRHRLARVANFVSSSDDRGVVAVAPGSTMIEDLLAFPSFDFLPPLETIAAAPVVAADGTLVTTPGYVESAQTYYHEADERLPAQLGDTTPTPSNVAAARDLLMEDLLGDFPYVDEASRAHALAALLQPFVRPCIRGNTPLYLVDAPTQGTGKSLLAQTVAAVFLGRLPASTPCPDKRNDEEWRKLLTTALIEGPSHIWFDNLKYQLDSGALAQALTSQSWHDRLLGANTSVTLPIRCTWLLTANNIELDADFPRRSVWIRLNSNEERPEDRDVNKFHISDLEDYLITERPRIIHAVVTLLRAWIEAGRPEWTGQPIGSYVPWCRVMGGLLDVIGVPGFLSNRERLYAKTDPDRERWGAFVALWSQRFGTQAKGVADLIGLAVECEIVPDQERGSRNTFGRKLREKLETVVADHVIQPAKEKQNAAQYQLVTRSAVAAKLPGLSGGMVGRQARAQEPTDLAGPADAADAVGVNQVKQSESFQTHTRESRNPPRVHGETIGVQGSFDSRDSLDSLPPVIEGERESEEDEEEESF